MNRKLRENISKNIQDINYSLRNVDRFIDFELQETRNILWGVIWVIDRK